MKPADAPDETQQTVQRVGPRLLRRVEAEAIPPAPRICRRRRTHGRGEEPWPGYDELTPAEIEAVLVEGDGQRAENVAAYERTHKNRPEVLQSALTPARFLVTANT